ncbi:MAG: hypothetical protein RBS40_12915 [Rhodocyclaceae bacterium]|jgi:hypothetical protein|nr:hypothetical protein [Rhodocyclaceae bacterium]
MDARDRMMEHGLRWPGNDAIRVNRQTKKESGDQIAGPNIG